MAEEDLAAELEKVRAERDTLAVWVIDNVLNGREDLLHHYTGPVKALTEGVLEEREKRIEKRVRKKMKDLILAFTKWTVPTTNKAGKQQWAEYAEAHNKLMDALGRNPYWVETKGLVGESAEELRKRLKYVKRERGIIHCTSYKINIDRGEEKDD